MPDLWSLPSAAQFLAEVPPLVRHGGAVVCCDASTPPGLTAALRRTLREDFLVQDLTPCPGELPIAVACNALGMPGASLEDLGAQDVVLVIAARDLEIADQMRWSDFLTRFAAARSSAAVLFQTEKLAPKGILRLDWKDRMRRADAMIWAEYAEQNGRNAPIQKLAVDLAVELCGWRLDLVADVVTQREEDILDPMGWLSRNADRADPGLATFGQQSFACPLSLFALGDHAELRRRIWTAQLSVLFPWIEDRRQRLIDRYRKQLWIDEHLRALGVETVEDIELGGLRRQLMRVLARDEMDCVDALARMRNDLAHRKPVKAEDFVCAKRFK